eukprot:2552820-Lingulodinium_polyedra.AAC.1
MRQFARPTLIRSFRRSAETNRQPYNIVAPPWGWRATNPVRETGNVEDIDDRLARPRGTVCVIEEDGELRGARDLNIKHTGCQQKNALAGMNTIAAWKIWP